MPTSPSEVEKELKALNSHAQSVRWDGTNFTAQADLPANQSDVDSQLPTAINRANLKAAARAARAGNKATVIDSVTNGKLDTKISVLEAEKAAADGLTGLISLALLKPILANIYGHLIQLYWIVGRESIE